jgi:hypothetical protein
MKHGASKLRILILGYLVRGPMGGMCWQNLNYMAGLARLGHEVYFLEDSDDYDSCFHPATWQMDRDPRYGFRFTDRALRGIGLPGRWAYYDAHTKTWFGPCSNRVADLISSADLLLNFSGVNPLRPWLMDVPVRVYLDIDPAFTQLNHLLDAAKRARAEMHTSFLSIGENIGRLISAVPDDGLPWLPTRQPVVFDLWPASPGHSGGKFTTVMQWDSYRTLHWNGQHYGMKSETFRDYLDFPKKVTGDFEIVLNGPAPRELMKENGWQTRKPHRTAGDPWTYQRYLQRSKAEFTVAKHGYVVSHCGWFSERSAYYLASGRPVITQETGFSEWLPTGRGVFAFTNPDEARAAVETLNASYSDNCRAALELAEEYFDFKTVLPQMLDQAS